MDFCFNIQKWLRAVTVDDPVTIRKSVMCAGRLAKGISRNCRCTCLVTRESGGQSPPGRSVLFSHSGVVGRTHLALRVGAWISHVSHTCAVWSTRSCL